MTDFSRYANIQRPPDPAPEDPFLADLARKKAERRAALLELAKRDPFAADLEWKASPEYAALKARKSPVGPQMTADIADPTDPTSTGEMLGAVGQGLKERLVGLARGVGTIAAHPVRTLTEPERRRELLRGIDDSVTLGYGRRAADYLSRDVIGSQDPTFAETEEQDRAVAPDVRAGGQLVGIALPSPARLAAAKAAQGAKAIVPLAQAPGALGAAGRAMIGYEAVAPAATALHADAGDLKSRLAAAGEAATDPGNLLLAAGTGLATGKLDQRLRGSRGYKAREFIEKEGKGAEVGLTSAGRGGVFARQLAGTEPTDKGIGQAAKIGAKEILAGMKGRFRKEAQEPFAAIKPEADRIAGRLPPRDLTDVVDLMRSAAYDLETADPVIAKLERKLNQLERYKDETTGAYLVPERQLNGLRRSLRRMAKVGDTDAPGEMEAPLRQAYFAVKNMVDEGPYARANQIYAQGSANLAAKRRQLGLAPKAPKNAATDVRKLKLTLEREGQNTKTAGGDSDIAAFRAENPELRVATNLPELQQSRADLTFRLAPRHGGLIERAAGGVLGPVGAAAASAAGHGVAGPLTFGLWLAAQNKAPIAGRVLYPLANAGVNPLVWAAMERKRREEEAAQSLLTPGL